mgnify:CR=1 FL=1
MEEERQTDMDKIMSILQEIDPYEDFDENTLLFEEGILDSLSLMHLISELESLFHIHISEEQIIGSNFVTAEKIYEFINTLIK